MLLFVAVMLPAVISVFIYDSASNGEIKPRQLVYIYSISNILINSVCALIKRFVLGTAGATLAAGTDMTPSALLNYMVIAVPAAIVIGFIVSLLKRANVRVSKE